MQISDPTHRTRGDDASTSMKLILHMDVSGFREKGDTLFQMLGIWKVFVSCVTYWTIVSMSLSRIKIFDDNDVTFRHHP